MTKTLTKAFQSYTNLHKEITNYAKSLGHNFGSDKQISTIIYGRYYDDYNIVNEEKMTKKINEYIFSKRQEYYLAKLQNLNAFNIEEVKSIKLLDTDLIEEKLKQLDKSGKLSIKEAKRKYLSENVLLEDNVSTINNILESYSCYTKRTLRTGHPDKINYILENMGIKYQFTDLSFGNLCKCLREDFTTIVSDPITNDVIKFEIAKHQLIVSDLTK